LLLNQTRLRVVISKLGYELVERGVMVCIRRRVPIRNSHRLAIVRGTLTPIMERSRLCRLLRLGSWMGDCVIVFNNQSNRRVLVWGYDSELLKSFVKESAIEVKLFEWNWTSVVDHYPSRQVVDEQKILRQPYGSKMMIRRGPNEVAITMPQWNRPGIEVFFLYLSLACAIIPVLILANAIRNLGLNQPVSVGLLLASAFLLCWIGTFFLVVDQGIRAYQVTVADNRFTVDVKTPFRRLSRSWARDEIISLCVQPSNYPTRCEPSRELQLKTTDGTAHSLITTIHFSESELHWIEIEMTECLNELRFGGRSAPPSG
jgi:hypothetical protein